MAKRTTEPDDTDNDNDAVSAKPKALPDTDAQQAWLADFLNKTSDASSP